MSDKWRQELVTVKVPTVVHEAYTILQKRYGDKRMGDAVLKHLEDLDENLIADAIRALEVKQQLEDIYKPEDDK